MNESEQADQPLDPKEAMRQALERKKERERPSSAPGVSTDRDQGHAQGQAGSHREFRRKSG